MPAAGVGLVSYRGSLAELEGALVTAGCTRPTFVTSGGAWVSYPPNARFVAINAEFEALFAEGIALGRALLVTNCG